MVDFELNEEQEMLVELARTFADDELIPNASIGTARDYFPQNLLTKPENWDY